MKKPHKGRIENWERRNCPQVPRPFEGKVHLGFQITGTPIGHPNFKDWICTSLVVKFNERTMQIETLNSIYDLGTPAKKS